MAILPASIDSFKYIIKGFLLGQILALFQSGTGVTSELLTERIKVNIPACQSLLVYILVTSTFGVYHLWKHGFAHLKSKYGLWCIFLAATDFAATYITVKAYQYTSMVSVQMLDCISIPTIMILSYLIFRVRYKFLHYFAVTACICGVGMLLFVDSHEKNSWKGDLMVAFGATLYGINNVCLEWLAKDIGVFCYLGMYCWFGVLLSGIQVIILERDALESAPWSNPDFYLVLIGFAICLVGILSLMPLIMIEYSATVANLNLLVADVYSAIFGYTIFHVKFNPLYIISMVIILSGILIYIYQSHIDERRRITPEDIEQSSSLVVENQAAEGVAKAVD